jgi:hypothetical protein
MNGDDSLDAFFDDLRQPATASELAGESDAVDALVTAVMSTKGSSVHILSNSRRLRVASFVAAGIIGFGGVAAAGPAVYDTVAGSDDSKREELSEEPTESVVETTMAPEPSVPESTVASSLPANDDPEIDLAVASADEEDDEAGEVTTTVALVDDPDTDFDETTCADGNHGNTVSSIARETPRGPGKGQIVSEAAHSSCGKDGKPDDDSEDLDDDESDDHEDGKSDDHEDGESDDHEDGESDDHEDGESDDHEDGKSDDHEDDESDHESSEGGSDKSQKSNGQDHSSDDGKGKGKGKGSNGQGGGKHHDD